MPQKEIFSQEKKSWNTSTPRHTPTKWTNSMVDPPGHRYQMGPPRIFIVRSEGEGWDSHTKKMGTPT